MEQVFEKNLTAAEVFSEVEAHPYMAVVAFLITMFVLGSIVMCMRTTSTGVKTFGTGIYYLTAPIHMPLRWAYDRI